MDVLKVLLQAASRKHIWLNSGETQNGSRRLNETNWMGDWITAEGSNVPEGW